MRRPLIVLNTSNHCDGCETWDVPTTAHRVTWSDETVHDVRLCAACLARARAGGDEATMPVTYVDGLAVEAPAVGSDPVSGAYLPPICSVVLLAPDVEALVRRQIVRMLAEHGWMGTDDRSAWHDRANVQLGEENAMRRFAAELGVHDNQFSRLLREEQARRLGKVAA